MIRAALGVSLVLLGLYVLTSPGRIDMVDGQVRYEVARNWIDRGRPVVLDRALISTGLTVKTPGAAYGVYNAAASVMAMPMMLVSRALPGHGAERDRFLFAMVGPLFGALLGGILVVAYSMLGVSLGRAVAWALVCTLGTLWWPASTTVFDQNQHAVWLLLAVLLAWFAERRLDRMATPCLTDDPARLPDMDVALVLGAAPIGPEGGPNRYFEYRLDAAAALWRAGKVKYLLVSGDNRRNDYDEPTAMRAGLLARGVPATAIYRDFAGLRTRDSVLRARSVFGQQRVIIVSQRFHLSRALFLAREEGIEACGFEARDVDNPYSIFTTLRRYPSALRAYWDVWLETPSRHTGQRIAIGVDPPN